MSISAWPNHDRRRCQGVALIPKNTVPLKGWGRGDEKINLHGRGWKRPAPAPCALGAGPPLEGAHTRQALGATCSLGL